MLGAAIVLSLAGTTLCGAPRGALLPSSGPIKRRDQAVATAFKAAVKVYGPQEIESERPLQALRSGPFWKVEGSLPPGYLGGVVEVTLNAKNGTVVDICHGK